ncbi:helix-turn-helix transcriptional regulator [Anaeropeptidivorans aminofermentans]|uniref:helix-turn-helix transcriptional regulator n=1 Tax=Anaeropeptidivorans aminofermentans TaxID=2934315 RepID=UPI000ECF24A0|nr:AraC family transcriptional regulator [Anaeropeptidivorans aminofermentans]MBE6011571.1 helix-turn-helix transcriptional regulator [Lachnospiraceae bacterium]HAQ40673.1 hypothetical protein [Clostridiales bacterium]
MNTAYLDSGKFYPSFELNPDFSWVVPVCVSSYSISEPYAINTASSNESILIYMLEGKGQALSKGTCRCYQKDSFIYANANISIKPSADTSFISIMIKNSRGLCDQLEIYKFNPVDGIREKFISFFENFSKGNVKDIYTASANTHYLIMEIKKASSCTESKISPAVRDAMKYMENNFFTIQNLEEVAKHSGVSKSHLIRRFRAETGKTPCSILQEIRMEYARLLLIYETFGICEISAMIGYSDPDYFCKVFRRVSGTTPASFRKQNKKGASNDDECLKKLRFLQSSLNLQGQREESGK